MPGFWRLAQPATLHRALNSSARSSKADKLAWTRVASACTANLLGHGASLRLARPAPVVRRAVVSMAQRSDLETRRDKAAGAGGRRRRGAFGGAVSDLHH